MRKIRDQNIKFEIDKDNNFVLEKNEKEPELKIVEIESFEQPSNNEKLQNKKNTSISFEVVKFNNDGNIKIAGSPPIPTISVTNENNFEIQRNKNDKLTYSKNSSFEKLEESKNNSYEYKANIFN